MLGSSAHEAGFKMKLQSMFTNYDSDGDGSLDKDEFMTCCAN
eukprot:COSAG04_NODE_1882_length_5314_cov_4.133461_4_plen_41_part_01